MQIPPSLILSLALLPLGIAAFSVLALLRLRKNVLTLSATNHFALLAPMMPGFLIQPTWHSLGEIGVYLPVIMGSLIVAGYVALLAAFALQPRCSFDRARNQMRFRARLFPGRPPLVIPMSEIESIVIQSREDSDGWRTYCLAVVTVNQTISLEKVGGCFSDQERAEWRALTIRTFIGLRATRDSLLSESLAKAQSEADDATVVALQPRTRYFT
jgi:hypothetical protein